MLRCLLPGFLAFTAAAVLAWPAWPRLLRASLLPALSLRGHHPAGALALLGTMLTGYVCAWKTVQRGAEDPAGTVDGSGWHVPRPERRRRRVHRGDPVVDARA